MKESRLRLLPSVESLKQHAIVAQLLASRPAPLVTEAIRRVIERLRNRLKDAGQPLPPVTADHVDLDFAASQVAGELDALLSPSLVGVINATGVIIHTNLGRAPLSQEVWTRMESIATGYSNLEYDLDEGKRGSRFVHTSRVLSLLTGAEDSLVVNNNAAAVLLVLTALSRGREVIVSRGELVEIGGSFRIPEIMAQGGAILREVGTTNRTRLSDYENAIGPATGLLLKVHRSNFALTGFVEEPTRGDLADLAARRGIPLFEDLGSGQVSDLTAAGIPGTDLVSQAVASGADLVSFSGDKMLGGPQAGVVVGKARIIAVLRTHPLTRALRPDKLTLAGLEATALSYLAGTAARDIPVPAMLTQPVETVMARAEALASALSALQGVSAQAASSTARVGGGAQPELAIPSAGVSLSVDNFTETALDLALRHSTPPVICRIESGTVFLDARTLRDDDIATIVSTVEKSLRS